MTNNKKRRAPSSGDEDAPPAKRQRLNTDTDDHKDLEEDDAAMNDATEEKEHGEVQSLTDVRQVLDFNVDDLSSRQQVVDKFEEIANTLMRDTVIAITPKGKDSSETQLFRFVEVEFYFLDGNHHPDVYAHCDKLQLETCACWYFHRAGNNSMEGYQLMTMRANSEPDLQPHFRPKADLEQAVQANKNFRGGSYKGLDITFGRENVAFGGMLIRAIEEFNPVHSAFSQGGQYSPGNLIEGPSKTVDAVVAAAGVSTLNELHKLDTWSLDCFDEGNQIMHLKWAHDYPSTQTTRATGDINFYEKACHPSPRVGLTFKPPGSMHASVLRKVIGLKQEFIVAPYRFIRTSRLPDIKKLRNWVFLSLLGHYSVARSCDISDVVRPVMKFMNVKESQRKSWVTPFETAKENGRDEVLEKFKGKGKFNVAESCALLGGLFPF